MTLIIGIRCQGGAILAADSATTYAVPVGPQPIATTTVDSKKLKIHGNLAIGISGPVGISQDYNGALKSLLANNNNKWPEKWDYAKSKKTLERLLWTHAQERWERAEMTSDKFQQCRVHEAQHSVLMALPIEDEPRLFEFTPQCNAEEKTPDMPFVAIGSGQSAADPFLRFLWDRIWLRKCPAIADGLLGAIWSLHYVIEHTSSGAIGVAGPIRAIKLTKDESGNWITQEINAGEIGQELENVKTAEDKLRAYFANIRREDSASAGPIPE